MELLTWSLVLAFALSVGFNLCQTQILQRQQRKIAERDSLIDDLRSAIGGGGSAPEAWRKDVL